MIPVGARRPLIIVAIVAVLGAAFPLGRMIADRAGSDADPVAAGGAPADGTRGDGTGGTTAGGQGSVPGDGEASGRYPVDPYVDPAQATTEPSFYAQPWRAYLETVPGTQFLDGLGVVDNIKKGDHGDGMATAAAAGFRTVRLEVPWGDIGTDDRLTPAARTKLVSTLADYKANKLVPLILLNSHHGRPAPSTQSKATMAAAAPAGATSIRLQSTAGLVVGRSGLSKVAETRPTTGRDPNQSASERRAQKEAEREAGLRPQKTKGEGTPFQGQVMAGILITAIGDDGTVSLSRKLPVALAAGADVTIDTLAYAPFHPVGTPQFEATTAGWLRYVREVLDTVKESTPTFSVEIWNELAFGSSFLSIDNYYDDPPGGKTKGPFQAGGSSWEFAKRTVDLVHSTYPGVKAFWGFSSTDFLKTKVGDLPPKIDGQSYHPYRTASTPVPADFPKPEARAQYDVVPTLTLSVPEGRGALGVDADRITKLVSPDARRAKPPGTTAFQHIITEHGTAPNRSGFPDPAKADAVKAKALLRASTFWLNKGMSRYYAFALNDQVPAGYQLLDDDMSASPALDSLKRLVARFSGSTRLDKVRPLGFEVVATGSQPMAFPASGSQPGLPYRDMIVLLPFQITADRFVVVAYVLGLDQFGSVPEMTVELTTTGIKTSSTVVLDDPIAGTTKTLSPKAAGGGVTVTVGLTDSPRVLVFDKA